MAAAGCPCIRGAFKQNSPPVSSGMKRKTLLCFGPPLFCNSKCPIFGLHKAGAPAAVSEMEQGQGMSGAWGTHLCGQGFCALGVAWAICLLQPLCQVSCSQLPGVHLGWGKRALQGCTNPGKCSRPEFLRRLCGVQMQGSQVAKGVRSQ